MAKDGKYVNLSVATQQDWDIFCAQVVERDDLLTDERFADVPARRKNRDVLERLVEEIFLQRDSDEWLERLQKANLGYGRVRDIGEVLDHPQVKARNIIREIDSPVGRIPTIESALRLSDSPIAEGPLPALGADTDAVLREAGYSDNEIKVFHDEGAV
jgi:crotonobetainyl-CoA:carnitine CoA-transferase CaiB-like acyl-CoA transferase